jgi:hypothetical protein
MMMTFGSLANPTPQRAPHLARRHFHFESKLNLSPDALCSIRKVVISADGKSSVEMVLTTPVRKHVGRSRQSETKRPHANGVIFSHRVMLKTTHLPSRDTKVCSKLYVRLQALVRMHPELEGEFGGFGIRYVVSRRKDYAIYTSMLTEV